MIPTRKLPRAALELSELSLGCAQLGNLYREVSDQEAQETIEAAWALGVRYYDTAPHYGLGLSEQRLGRTLAEHPRAEFVLSSKAGRLLAPVEHVDGLDNEGFVVPAAYERIWDFSREGIRRSISESLERLGLDALDIVYLHDAEDHMREVFATGYAALEELRSEGALTAIGAGMNYTAPLIDLVRDSDVDVIMLAGRYTLLEQTALEELLPLCVKRRVGVVAAGVFNSGLLAKARPSAAANYNYAEAPAELVQRAARIAEVCERHGTTLPAAALAFPLAHPAVVSVCVGARSRDQVERNAALYAESIAPELWRELKEERLLREDAPVGDFATS
ncbi:MAG TPA: aldo/keto reductase [Solirubrobacteraceae bacterium]|nr:aldo/keto reductase [Solirubrobacteraceae bacterium]